MLNFFRRYQRYFFLFIAIIVIASFVFFGTFSAMGREATSRKDHILGHAVDGSPLWLFEVQALSRFISSDREDFLHPNMCNDGVVRRDLLQSGLADLLASAYFETLRNDFTARLEKARKFRPYAHPEIPEIGVEAAWRMFAPQIHQEVLYLRREDSATPRTFSHWVRLYRRQDDLPPSALHRILHFQQKQLGGSQIHPKLQGLRDEDLALFGFHSLSDWFGLNFLDLSAEFILNAAAFAEAKGYRVTLEEAKGDLLYNFRTSMQQTAKPHSAGGLSLQGHLRALGFEEGEAAKVWRKILLFRRYFQGVSQASFQDRLPFQEFDAYAHETARICLYRWPATLQLKGLFDLTDFQIYLHAVAPSSSDPLALPSHFYSPEEVKKRDPELVLATFRAKVRKISLAEVALHASVKELWEWQLCDPNWEFLRKAFPFLPDARLREERFSQLERLASSQRTQIDGLSRLRLVDSHPEWVEEALAAAPEKEESLFVSQTYSSLAHVANPSRLYDLCRDSANGDGAAREALLRYADDGKMLYRLEGVYSIQPDHVLTFAEARQLGVLRDVVDRRLQEAYLQMRVQESAPFQTKEGQWRSFAEVRELVSRQMLSGVFRAIAERESPNFNREADVEWSDALYASYRMLHPASMALDALRKNPEDSRWLGDQGGSLQQQFQLEKQEIRVQRADPKLGEGWMKEKKERIFQMRPNEWSGIYVPSNGDISFFYLAERTFSERPVFDRLSLGKQLIAADAQRYLAERLLEKIRERQAIAMPVRRDS